MKPNLIAVVAALLFLGGCNGKLYEYVDNNEYPTKPSADGQGETGVRVYMPAYMKVVMRFTTRIDPETKTASTKCDGSKEFAQIQQKCDYSRPLRLVYKPGLLETSTFSVTTGADGCLLAVNTQSTPVASTVGTFIPALITAAAAAAAGPHHPSVPPAPLPECAGDPVMVGAPERCTDAGNCAVQ